MARRKRRYVVPEAAAEMQSFKAKVMKGEGYAADPGHPDDVKYEVAKELGIPLQQGGNGGLTTEAAGRIGGKIGGSMVREMISMAMQELEDQEKKK